MIRYALIIGVLLATCASASADTWCYYDGDTAGVYSGVKDSYGGWSNNYYLSSHHDMYIKWYAYTNQSGTPVSAMAWGNDDQCAGGASEGSLGASAPYNNGEYFLYDGGTNSSGLKLALYHFPLWFTFVVSDVPFVEYTASGTTDCITTTSLYIYDGTSYAQLNTTTNDSYSWEILEGYDYRLMFDDAYHDFTCDGDEVFDNYMCFWVYGYSCGIDTIKLRDSNSQLVETVYQDSGYDVYEIGISSGEGYTISFYDMDSILCYSQSFTSTGDNVLIDYDRCNWVWPPSPWGPPIIIYLWAGYDYNIVVFRDTHGNFIENSQLAIYDKTDGQYLQQWTDASEGYTLLGTRFDTDHDAQLMLRTFDGVFTLDTTYPANGSAVVGEENITTINWTIPINYNLNVLPVDQSGSPLFDVFCGLSEYTPLDPGSFWGMDLSDQGYVSVTNCSGFSMCDIVAEKDGYVDYTIEALNWTSKSALIKDYRHNVIMEEE